MRPCDETIKNTISIAEIMLKIADEGDMVREENYKITRLANGTRVITETLPFIESFSLGFWIDTGSRVYPG